LSIIPIDEEGRALEAAQWLARGEDGTFLIQGLENATFNTRMGLLYALEEALEINPGCLDNLVKPLLPYLEAEAAPLRGDVADLLGKIGHPDALPGLEPLRLDPDPDVAEAAEEAIEQITENSK